MLLLFFYLHGNDGWRFGFLWKGRYMKASCESALVLRVSCQLLFPRCYNHEPLPKSQPAISHISFCNFENAIIIDAVAPRILAISCTCSKSTRRWACTDRRRSNASLRGARASSRSSEQRRTGKITSVTVHTCSRRVQSCAMVRNFHQSSAEKPQGPRLGHRRRCFEASRAFSSSAVRKTHTFLV